MTDLPRGIVTFFFTDVEGSTRLWEDAPDTMMEALTHHDAAVDSVVDEFGGVSVKPRGEGDSRFVVFPSAPKAVAAAAELQRLLSAIEWPTPRPLKVRTSLHTGEADLQLGDYYGSAVNRAARLRAIAHGGQTVMSGATWELVAEQLPDGITVEDMGEHGLKDLTRPEHVYQLHIAGLPETFPPLASLGSIPNNLPRQLTDFLGRERELAEAKQLLTDTRLLTILAPGGTGKSRLAIQMAADLADDYTDGVFFIALADIGSSDHIIQAVAEALGVGLSSDDDLQVQLLTYLSNKRQLLVFDNFEHVQEGASIIAAVLREAPAVRVVATSRSKLNLTGETTMTLAGLDITWSSVEEAFQASGVQLFIDASKRSKPGFELTVDDLVPLAQILQLTGGMPLAILLAAAWVDMLPVPEIAAEISKSLDFLETEMGDVPDRHRSVRAVFDYSWALLGEQEREIFARLAVFRGGFSREAADEIAGASLRNLATLANKSLVSPSPETGRYSVHELLRQYAEAELESDAETHALVLDAHARFYAASMEDVTGLRLTNDQPHMLALVNADIDNFRAAWRHFLSIGDGAGASKLMYGLFPVYEWRGWYPSAVALFGEALEVLDSDSDDHDIVTLRAMAQGVQGWFLALLGQPEAGRAQATEAKASLPQGASIIETMVVDQCLAISLAYVGEVEEMAELTDRSIELASTMDDAFYGAAMRNWRCFAAFLGGDVETAKRLIPEAMAVFEERDEHYYMTWALWLQALIATMESRPLDAIDLFTRQVARAEELDYLRGKVVAFEGLGDANASAGRPTEAATAYIQSLITADQMGMARDMLGLMAKTAAVRAAEGQVLEAVEILASVIAEPMSAQQPFTATVPIRDTAAETLARLEAELAETEYHEAQARGTALSWEVTAKTLMDSLSQRVGV